MKKRVLFLLLAVVMLAASSFAQVNQRLPAFGYEMDRVLVLKTLGFPRVSVETLNGGDSTKPALIYVTGDSTKLRFYSPETKSWHFVGTGAGGGTWGSITGTLSDQLDLWAKFGTKPDTSRTFTINGVTYTLGANRTWSVGTLIGNDTTKLRADINKKADTSDLLQIDLLTRQNGRIAYWDSAANKLKWKVENAGGSGAFKTLAFREGDELAPVVGDTSLTNNGFRGQFLFLYRNGILQEEVFNDTGYYRANDSTVWIKPPIALNDRYFIEARDTLSRTALALQAPATPPSTTIAYVGATDGGNNAGSGTTRTYSVTVSSGSNRILLVGVVGDVLAGADDVTGVTYAGVSMTFINKTDDGNRRQYLYYLLNPTSGANNVVVTASTSHWLMSGAIEYTGVQGIDVTATNKATGASSITSTVTTTTNNNWNVIFSQNQGSVQNAGSGATKRTPVAVNQYWTWFDSGGAITPAGSYSMTTSLAAGANIGHCIVSIKPY